MIGGIGGVRIHEDPHLVDVSEDWSRVRSRARAARRRSAVSRRGRKKRAHRQNIDVVTTPKTEAFRVMLRGEPVLVCHPVFAANLRFAIEAKNRELQQAQEEAALGALLGRPPLQPGPSPPSYTCPRCKAVSYNPNDIRERYCGRCHQFEEL